MEGQKKSIKLCEEAGRWPWETELQVFPPGHKSQALDEPQMGESSLCEEERRLVCDNSKPIQSAKCAHGVHSFYFG